MKWSELDPHLQSGKPLGQEGWESLLASMRPRLLAILRSRGADADLAEDVVQEALVLIWRRWHTLREQDRVDSWATSILLNRLRTHLVRRREDREVPQHLSGPRDDPLQELVRSEGVAWLFGALAELPRAQRDPVTLRMVHGLSSESACRALGITRPCLRRRLHEGITRLRRRARSPAGKRAASAMGFAPEIGPIVSGA